MTKTEVSPKNPHPSLKPPTTPSSKFHEPDGVSPCAERLKGALARGNKGENDGQEPGWQQGQTGYGLQNERDPKQNERQTWLSVPATGKAPTEAEKQPGPRHEQERAD